MEGAVWKEEEGKWEVTIRNLITNKVYDICLFSKLLDD